MNIFGLFLNCFLGIFELGLLMVVGFVLKIGFDFFFVFFDLKDVFFLNFLEKFGLGL